MPEKKTDSLKCHDFKIGDTILVDTSKIKGWDEMPDAEKYKNYSWYFVTQHKIHEPEKYLFSNAGGDVFAIKPKLFTFICEHNPQEDHGVVVEISNEYIYGPKFTTMAHLYLFRKATLEEC